MQKQFVSAREISEIMGVSTGKAYQIIRILNKQLQDQGYVTIAGKCNRRYFEERCLYGGTTGD